MRFKDIRFIARSLDDLRAERGYVLVFTNTSCPIAQKYWPKLKRLSDEFEGQGIQFVGINSSEGDAIPDVAQQAIDFEIGFPVVKDTDGSCARALGIERTPEVAVLDSERNLRYRGRIDDQYRLGGARPEVTSDDLHRALTELIAGKPVSQTETPVDGCRITLPQPSSPTNSVAYYPDIAPLIQQHCQECHRPNGGAPFSLMSLEEVQSHAQMIAEVVGERRMPPWYAHRAQHFANERTLTATQRDKIISWVNGGRLPGDPAQAPPPRAFSTSKWSIGKPDLITTALLADHLPAEGFVDYRYAVLPFVFTEDTWISAAEIRPSNPQTVHHCNMAYVTVGEQFDPSNFITGRVPGGTAMILDEGVGFRIPKNSVIGLQIHYTTTGKPEVNTMSVGFRFPRGTVKQELHHEQITTSHFAIPAGAAAHPVTASRTLPFDAAGIGMFSHMHLRGKDMTFKAHYPDGSIETLLSIPNYHYDWQQNYRWQPGTKIFPKGTHIEVLAHFDNSRFNPFNPDPNVVVRHGPQTIHEMMFGFLFYTSADEDLNLKINPKTGHVIPAAENMVSSDPE